MSSVVPPSSGALETPPVHNLVRTRIPTRHGEFTLHYYLNDLENKEHLALVMGEVGGAIDVPVRVHSECLTGDVFGSMRCDCGDQLDRALQLIGKAGRGVLIYLRQEGRGIGLLKKLQAYNLQDQGLDTVEANIRLGHLGDERDYGIAASILADLRIGSVRLITNNPRKIAELRGLGIDVTERIPIEVPYNAENEGYLRTKARKMQHLLKLQSSGGAEFVFLDSLAQRLDAHARVDRGKVFVSLSYVQSLDGAPMGEGLSGDRLEGFLRMVRYLESLHDGVLVPSQALTEAGSAQVHGARCIILDNPTADHNVAELPWPAGEGPIILTRAGTDPQRQARIRERGGQIVEVELGEDGRMDFAAALRSLACLGLRSVLVVGQGCVAEECLAARAADYCVIAVSPELVGPARQATPSSPGGFPGGPLSISDCRYHLFEESIIVHGSLHAP